MPTIRELHYMSVLSNRIFQVHKSPHFTAAEWLFAWTKSPTVGPKPMIVTIVFLPTISVAASLKDRPTGTQPVQYSFSVRYSLTTTSSSLTSSGQGSMDLRLGLEIRSLNLFIVAPNFKMYLQTTH